MSGKPTIRKRSARSRRKSGKRKKQWPPKRKGLSASEHKIRLPDGTWKVIRLSRDETIKWRDGNLFIRNLRTGQLRRFGK